MFPTEHRGVDLGEVWGRALGQINMREIVVLLAVALSLTSCSLFSLSPSLCLTDFSHRMGADGRIHLAQCWDQDDQKQFYTTSQGSQIAPYKIATHLELPDSMKEFLASENIERWGYLKGQNPDGWPLGLVKDTVKSGKWKGEWIGMTCAACHTAEIHYKGSKIRIDGGPAMADFTRFINELDASLEETYKDGLKKDGRDGEKFERYASRFNESERVGLLDRLGTVVKKRQAWRQRNDPKLNNQSISHGYARLDAFGVIFNEVTNKLFQIPENNAVPNAPVSYPFLWDTHYHDWTQWNGVSAAIPMGRNVGQVLGVFAQRDMKTGESTIRLENLRALQNLVKKLRSPKWPEDEDILGAIDQEKADRGKVLFFKDQRCSGCHASQEREKLVALSPFDTIEVTMTEREVIEKSERVGLLTDSKMAENAGRQVTDPNDGKIPATDLLAWVVRDEILSLRHPLEAVRVLIDTVLAFLDKGTLTQPKLGDLAYKARPLDGIWATAPYLHNGSVANLYELLLPAEQRLKEFYVGSRTFDPMKVGFVTTKESVNQTLLDTAVEGNSKEGHEYGNDLSDEERWALVEYMKTL